MDATVQGQGGYAYDGAGNLLCDPGHQCVQGQSSLTPYYAYDAEDRMTGAGGAPADGGASYTYDGDGRRVRRNVGGAEVWQVYGLSGELLAEYAANASPNSPQKEYGYRNGELLVTAAVTGGWGAAPVIHDNPLVAGQTTVQSRHITELRSGIDSLRSHLGLGGYGWNTPAAAGAPIKADPILEMRAALDQALGAPANGYSAGLAQGQPVLAMHIQELRDRLLNAWQGGATGVDLRWLVADQLGTPRMVIDKTGSLSGVRRHDYFPFGEEIPADGSWRTTTHGYGAGDGVRQKFTGYERDIETGLDFAEARMYGYSLGRFTSPDNFLNATHASNPQSWDLYVYVTNNPLIFTDPTGMTPTDFIDQEGNRTHIKDGKDQVLYAENTQQLQDQFHNDRAAYNHSVERIAAGTDNFHMTVAEFNHVAGTIYAEATDKISSAENTAEAAGMFSVLNNKAIADRTSIYDQASVSHGIYGASESNKIFDNNASESKRNAVYAGMALAVHTGHDYSNGAFYWQGVDFHITSSNAYKLYYKSGFHFTNSTHDIWGMGDNAVNGVVGKGSNQRTYSYKYESTGAAGHTIFMRLNDGWKQATGYHGRY